MIRSLPNSRRYLYSYKFYMGLYFAFLFAPLVVTCVLAFNDSQFPALPWKGFTLEWFTGDLSHRVGIFHDRMNLESIWVSAQVAFFVTILSVTVGTCAAFLFEQEEFPFKSALYFLMLSPLVIPGVILGISILLFSNTLGMFFETTWGIDVPLFRPGFWWDEIYAPTEVLPATNIIVQAENVPPEGNLRMTVEGENLDGKFVSRTVMLPLGPAGDGEARLAEAGLELRTEDGKVFADNVMFGSAAQDVGIDFDWEILNLEVDAERPPKQLMFIPALLLLGFIAWSQRRRVKANATVNA